MPEATPPPDPPAGGGPTEPGTPPTVPTPDPWAPPGSPAAWAPPDPLTAPQPWAPPTPWSPSDSPTHPDAAAPAGSYFPTHRPGTPPTADRPGPAGTDPDSPTALSGGGYPPVAGPRPATPPPGYSGPPLAPPPGHPWPGYAPSGWPPPAYPPPYAYPGGAQPAGGNGRLAAILVSVAVVLVLTVCGCLGGLGVLGSMIDDRTSSADPYDDTWPAEPDETAPDDDGLITATPNRTPAATPSGGTGRTTVVYEVTGTGRAYLQYYDANGDFIQADGVKLPWRLRLTTDAPGRVMVLTSHADDSDTGPLRCRILVDGKVVAEETSEYGGDCYG